MRTTLWCIYAFFWIGGTIQGGVSTAAPWAAPLFLVLAGALALMENKTAWQSMLLAATLGFVLEIVGVHTGYPFGRYNYTAVLAPSIFGVPLAIAFAWLILIDYVRGMSANIWIGALLMTAIDLVIDPLAAGPLAYWHWLDGGDYFGIPALNFAGWFAASLLILYVTPKQSVRRAYVGWTVIAFFAVLALRKAFYLPGAIGLTLLALPFSRLPGLLQWNPVTPSGTPSRSSPASG